MTNLPSKLLDLFSGVHNLLCATGACGSLMKPTILSQISVLRTENKTPRITQETNDCNTGTILKSVIRQYMCSLIDALNKM